MPEPGDTDKPGSAATPGSAAAGASAGAGDGKRRKAAEDAIEHAPGSPHAVLAAVIDDAIAQYASGAYESSVAAARREHDERRGRVFVEDDELWEAWTQAFLEWYVAERPLAVPGQQPGQPARPPVARIALEARARGDDRQARAAMAWLTSQRSLFEVRALRAGRVELLDLLGGGQFSVLEKRAMAGVSVGDVAEMRLIGFEDDVLFGRTFCFHPAGTREAILAHARRIRTRGGLRHEVMDHCASLRIRCLRYRHVPPTRIYESTTSTDVDPGTASRTGTDSRAS